MEIKKQKDVIFEIIKEALGDSYSSIVNYRNLIDVDMIIMRLVTKINSGEFKIDKHFENNTELHIYLRKLVFNWLNKDTRLNGGHKYKDIKAPKRVHWSVHRAITQEKQPIVHDIFSDYMVKEIIKLIHECKIDTDDHDICVAALIERVIVISERKLTIQIERQIKNKIELMETLKIAGYSDEEIKYILDGGKNPNVEEVEEQIEVHDPRTNEVIKQKVKILKYKSKKVA